MREQPAKPLPPDLIDGARIEPRPDGRVVIFAVEDNVATGFFATSNAGAGLVAAQILNTARASQETAKLPLPDTAQSNSYSEVNPSGIALGPSRNPNSVCLVMICGQAQIGFSLETGLLRELSQTLLALSAQGNAQ